LLFLQGHEGYEDNMIDDAIEDEFNENEQSFNPVSLRCCRCRILHMHCVGTADYLNNLGTLGAYQFARQQNARLPLDDT
jgi:hypothetical protein